MTHAILGYPQAISVTPFGRVTRESRTRSDQFLTVLLDTLI